MPSSARLLLTGATGNVGAAALRALLRLRSPGTVVVTAGRTPNHGRQQLTPEAADHLESVLFDFTKPETVTPALHGVTGLLLVRPPAISDVARYLQPVVQAAGAAGVRHERVVLRALQR